MTKIQCDVCNKESAEVFCAADEAALCGRCDRRVHGANKLASKHPRLSLLNPAQLEFSEQSQHVLMCDICQDRAILCKVCDVPIHMENDLTRHHSRFLLTRVQLSSPAPPLSYHFSEVICGSRIDDVNFDSSAREGGGGRRGSTLISPEAMIMEMLPHEVWHVERPVDFSAASVLPFGGMNADGSGESQTRTREPSDVFTLSRK